MNFIYQSARWVALQSNGEGEYNVLAESNVDETSEGDRKRILIEGQANSNNSQTFLLALVAVVKVEHVSNSDG